MRHNCRIFQFHSPKRRTEDESCLNQQDTQKEIKAIALWFLCLSFSCRLFLPWKSSLKVFPESLPRRGWWQNHHLESTEGKRKARTEGNHWSKRQGKLIKITMTIVRQSLSMMKNCDDSTFCHLKKRPLYYLCGWSSFKLVCQQRSSSRN